MNKVKIRLLTGLAGHRQNGVPFSYSPGTEVEWDAKEAARFVDAGYAEYVKASNGQQK